MTASKSSDPADSPNFPDDRPPSRLWKWIRRLAVTAFLLAIVLAATAWFSRDWLAAKSNDLLKTELNKRNIYADYDSSEFSLLRGLVFKGVNLHRTEEKTEPVITLSDVGIAFNPFGMLRGNLVIPRISTDDATFTAHHPEHPIVLSDLQIRATIQGDHVLIDHIDTTLKGIRLSLSGDISLASAGKDAGDETVKATQEEGAQGLGAMDLGPLGRMIDSIPMTPQGAPPLVRAHIVRKDDGSISASGNVSGKDLSWNDAVFESLNVDFTAGEGDKNNLVGVVRFPAIKLGYLGETFTASGAYHVASRTVEMNDLHSRIHLLRLLSGLFPALAESLSGIAFEQPPELTISGTLPLANPTEAKMKGSVAGAGLAIALKSGKKLQLSNVNADLTLEKGVLHSSNLTSNLLGGNALAVVTGKPFESPVRIDVDLKLGGLSLKEIGSLAGKEQVTTGVLHATFKGGGQPSLAGLSGGGSIGMEGGSMISVPVFRKLGPVLKSIIPGVNSEQAGMTATASYRLDNGVFSSNDIHLEDGQIIIDGTTAVNLEKKTLNATASAQTKGATKIITALAGKALEIEASGTFDNFTWRFKNLPGLGGVGKLTGTVTEGAGGAVKAGVSGVGEAAGGLLKVTGEATGLDGKESEDEKKRPLGRLKGLLPGKDK